MNPEQQKAYEWAKNQNYQSVAAQHAKILADLITSLQADLARVTAERDAAVGDLTMICINGETCAACVHCCNKGDQFPCAISNDWCGGEKWQWTKRGRRNAGMKYKKTMGIMLVAMTVSAWMNAMLGNIAGTIFGCTGMLILIREVRGE